MAAKVDGLMRRVPEWRMGSFDGSRTLREVVAGCIDHDVLGLGAEVAFHAALAVLPFVLLIAALPSVLSAVFSVPDFGQRISEEAGRHLSGNAASMVRTLVEQVTKTTGWAAFTIGFVGTSWAGISTTSSLRKALNRIYGFDEELPFLARKVLEIGVTLGVGVVYVAAVAAILLGPVYLGKPGVPADTLSLLVAISLVSLAVSLVYWLLPAHRTTFHLITGGAALFVIVWLIFSVVFSVYLSRFGTINRVYGSIGVMIVLLGWLYGSNVALLVGAEINAGIGRQEDPQVRGRSRTPEGSTGSQR